MFLHFRPWITPMSSIMEAITSRTIYLLTENFKTRNFVAINREAMEVTLKSFQVQSVGPTIKCHVGHLAGNKRVCKSIKRQHTRQTGDDMGTRKLQIMLHGVPLYITEDHLGAFFSDYGPVEWVSEVRQTLSPVITKSWWFWPDLSLTKSPTWLPHRGTIIYIDIKQ